MTRSSPASDEKIGKAAHEAGEMAEAVKHFQAARQGYLDQGDTAKAGEMANNLCVLYLQLDSPQQALSLVEGSPQMFDDLGLQLQTAQAYGNLASALEACGDLAAAEVAYTQACNRFSELGDRESLSLTTQALSQLQLRRGKALEALSSMQTSLDSAPKLGLRRKFLQKILDLPSRFLGR